MGGKHVRLVSAYMRLNLAAAMEYRVSFLVQMVGMALNDALMLVFWWIYFTRFPQVGGWTLREVLMLFGLVAAAFGLAIVVFGNSVRLATLIVQGQLDYYLSMPRNTLLHILVSRMGLAAWGDLSFGVLALVLAGQFDLATGGLACLLVAMSTAIFVAFLVMVGSLAFFVGNAETAASQAQGILVMFATYPGSVYHGWVRVLLFTAIPAAFVGHIPVDLLREFDLLRLAAVAGFVLVIWVVALCVFWWGLRRYESGNLVVLQG